MDAHTYRNTILNHLNSKKKQLLTNNSIDPVRIKAAVDQKIITYIKHFMDYDENYTGYFDFDYFFTNEINETQIINTFKDKMKIDFENVYIMNLSIDYIRINFCNILLKFCNFSRIIDSNLIIIREKFEEYYIIKYHHFYKIFALKEFIEKYPEFCRKNVSWVQKIDLNKLIASIGEIHQIEKIEKFLFHSSNNKPLSSESAIVNFDVAKNKFLRLKNLLTNNVKELHPVIRDAEIKASAFYYTKFLNVDKIVLSILLDYVEQFYL